MNRGIYMTIGVAFVLLIGLVLLLSALYSVDETEYGLELRFGEVRNVRTEPGLYVKAPLIDSVQRIDKRTLRADVLPREVPDRDKERLVIDMVVRYRIADPVDFRRTLRNEATAQDRLQDIMYSAMRDTIAQHDRTEVIGARPLEDESGASVYDDEGLPVHESLVDARDRIGWDILERVSQAVTDQNYGIEVISADIKRADFPSQVTSAIIDRLFAERLRVAARHRADGEEEYRKRTSAVQAQADILIAEANRDARKTRGKGDARAIAIVQQALMEDPGFYTFLRTLESYETSIRPGATVVLIDQPGGYLEMLTRPPEDQGEKNDSDEGSTKEQ